MNDGSNSSKKQKTLMILTLKKHEGGVWIRRLVKSLQATAEGHHIFVSNNNAGTQTLNTTEQSQRISIHVKPLEEWLAEGRLVSSCPAFFDNILGIVNRVSDAASPPAFKACCAILGAASLCKIPIVNGPTSYSLCGNKWCHHLLFQQAGLESPRTLAYWNDGGETINSDPNLEALSTHEMQGKDDSDLLIKPNSGGFGAGICRMRTPLDEPLRAFEDCMTLVQTYHPPKDNQLYRIWFLLGKVQCAVVRTDSHHDFTNACSGVCGTQTPPAAWAVGAIVRKELEDKLLPLLTDAHCGSVEFLYSRDGNKRLYFDLNLLSTLPVRVSNEEGVWVDDYDPWMELAHAVWTVVSPKQEKTIVALE